MSSAATVPVAYLAIAVVVSSLIAAISGMAIHQANSNVSETYNTTVKTFGWVAMGGALACLIALPIMLHNKMLTTKLLVMFLIALFLCVAVAAVSGMGIHLSSSPNASETYLQAVRGVAGTALALALASIIFVPILYVAERRGGKSLDLM